MKPHGLTRTSPTAAENCHAAARMKYLIAGAILFSLLALSGSLVAVKSQSGGFTVEYDTDRGGSDYKNYEVSGGHEVCRDACANDPKCAAYTYVKPWQGYSAKCWLKNSVPAPVPGRDCCISGVKNGGGGGTGFGPRNDQAGLTGERLTFYGGTTPEQCQADCAGNSRCKGYTYIRAGAYNPNDPPMCYLMSEATGFTPSTCCISAIKGGGGGGEVGGGGAFGGTWDAYAWDTITMEQNGDRVTGRWTGGGGGRLQGVVRGDRLYFSWRSDGDGKEGEAVMYPIDTNDSGRYGLSYCHQRGCDPATREGYVDAKRRR
jgi:hypothetical protein